MNLNELIERNFLRLQDEPYQVKRVFREPTYDWPGDMEGRAMLAFVCHYRMHGKKVPQFDEVFSDYPSHLNRDGFFGPLFDSHSIDEQQLSGNSWALRGLLAYGETFHNEEAFLTAKRMMDSLFRPALLAYPEYPLKRDGVLLGGVYGNLTANEGNWKLSSDVGCAFIALDGVCHYYQLFPDAELKEEIGKAIDFFATIDREKIHAQSHGTLSALRGILCFYEATKEAKYLSLVRSVFDLYLTKAMTLNYECFNWFGRPDTWSEPCAVTDSLILATKLYSLTKEERYKTLARRIFFNGFPFALRPNGGAGPNTCVTKTQPYLALAMDEAFQCCSMRYSEGLLTVKENLPLFAEENNPSIHQEDSRYFLGDHLLVEDENGYYSKAPHFEIDGKNLIEIPTMTPLTWEEARQAKLKVSF